MIVLALVLIGAVCIVCLAVAWFLMAAIGWLITVLQIPAIILTLAALPFYRGVALILADTFVLNFSGMEWEATE